MLISIVLLVVGMVALIKGADYMVEGASTLALKNNISKLAIGLTIVALGTSAPELVVNTLASFDKHYEIVYGNILGSNIFNLFLILGIVGVIAPITVGKSTVWKEIPISIVAAAVMLFVVNINGIGSDNLLGITRGEGVLLLFMFSAFLYYVYTQSKNNPDSVDGDLEQANIEMPTWKIWLFILGGLAGLGIGGKLVVDHAVNIATILGVSEKVIGLTIIAFGTSLPELTTSLVAIRKNSSDIAVGNIIGSNIFNIFLILGISALVNPLEYLASFNTDLYLLIGGSVFLFIAMFTGKKGTLDRWEAALFLIVFFGYMGYTVGKEFGFSF